MTIQELLATTNRRLHDNHIATPQLDAALLLAYASGSSREWLYAHAEEPLATCLQGDSLQKYEELIRQRERSVPVAYLTGTKEFYGLDFYVDKNVMIPRPESEAMIEYVIRHTPRNTRVLDVGTGSGALAVALKYHRRDLEVHASDNSCGALDIARRNVQRHEVPINITSSDLFAAYSDDMFDLILANLPYLPDNCSTSTETAYEPAQALYAGSDGLDVYRQLFEQAPAHTSGQALLVAEHLPAQRSILDTLASTVGFTPHETSNELISVYTWK